MEATGKTQWRHVLFPCSPYPPTPSFSGKFHTRSRGQKFSWKFWSKYLGRGSRPGRSQGVSPLPCCPQVGGASVGNTQGGGRNSEPKGRMR